MVFHKQAFRKDEHQKITAYIMGARFDAKLFQDVHEYIDRERGGGHREKHGHDETAEQEIKRLWGDAGVEMFKIHILSDWLHDNLGAAVGDLAARFASGEFPLPYYNLDLKDNRPSYETAIISNSGGCANCGSPVDLDPTATWFRGPTCKLCLTNRNLEVCVQCHALFGSCERVHSPENPGKVLCPVCAQQIPTLKTPDS